ncbi:MAG: peptidase S45 [Nitrospira sp. SCN 59-13]|nr:MAG: peptidase S45 [Nitrospira sp. SCN 59-13]
MKIGRRLCVIAAGALVAGAAVVWGLASASLPVRDGALSLAGLQGPVSVAFDEYGIPQVTAESRLDAFRVLGYLTAQDRLFQMDLLRRTSAGRLAEIFGEPAVTMDVRQRRLGLSQVAEAVVRRLPDDQSSVLTAYADGVNKFLEQMTTPPFEFLLLGYRPTRWDLTDSLLVVLAMFQMLNGSEDDERMRTVMMASLPAEVSKFLLPSLDNYTAHVLTGGTRYQPPTTVPVKALAALRRTGTQSRALQTSLVPDRKREIGSNAWVVGSEKTADGRAILANDMHLDVGVPNIWYRVQLRYGPVELAGVVVPGIPVVIAGSNGFVSWGLTNVEGDFLDLVRLEINPHNPDEYAVAEGWERFTVRTEHIAVKDAADRIVECKSTRWGPLAEERLMGQSVAIHWTALDPEAVDLGLLRMDQARSVWDAIAVATRAGAPPNNVLLADAGGHIAWTYMGKIPVRRGLDGSVSLSWADGRTGWNGYIPADELPRTIDPPSGYLVSANQRMTDETYPHVIGHAFASGYRAFRITDRLQAMERIREQDLLALQLDTTTQVYDFYRDLLRVVLTDDVTKHGADLADARRAVEAWNGRADKESQGFALLVAFRRNLAASVFAPFLQSCRDNEAGFVFDGDLDTPLRSLLVEQAPDTLPDPARFSDWRAFLLQEVEESVKAVKTTYTLSRVDDLAWGTVNRVRMAHPLSDAIPVVGSWLNMADDAASGCGPCVRVLSGSLTASERMVVSPAHHTDALFHMPGGQSGHPLSPHYRDQQANWSQGRSTPLLAGKQQHTLTFTPEDLAARL